MAKANGQDCGYDAYSDVAEAYKKSKQLCFRADLEIPSFMELVGTLRDESVVDLACGDGFYTRLLRQLTTGEVCGVDICERMIELARAASPKGDAA